MKFWINIERVGTVKDIQDRDDLQLVDNSQDVTEIKKNICGNRHDLDDFEVFFVNVDNGEYGDIYGIYQNIPHLSYDLYKITYGLK